MPQTTPILARYFARLKRGQPWRWRGQVLESVGQTIESAGPLASVGECCEIRDQFGRPHLAEVIGFRGSNVLSMPVETTEGIRFGDRGGGPGRPSRDRGGPGADGPGAECAGRADRWRPAAAGLSHAMPLDGAVRPPLDRVPIRTPLGTGIRVLDALLTVGRGQRVGIFGGSGVGKSTLIGMMTRNTEADVTVVGLVGERGREVGEFLEDVAGRGGPGALGGGGFHLRPVAADAHEGGAGRHHGGRVLCRPGEKRAAGAGFADPLRHGRARDRPGRRRAAHGQGIYALGLQPAGPPGGARRAVPRGLDHRLLYRADGGRRPAGPAGGRGAVAARRPCGALARPGRRGLVSAHRGAGLDQPADAGRHSSPSIASRPRCCAG